MELKMVIYSAEFILAACISFAAGQSTLLTPSPSVQQMITSVINETATVNVSMTISLSNYSLIQQQTSSVNPSSAVTVSVQSSVTSTSPTTTKDDDIEDDSEEKKKIALIAASCTGGFVLLLGLTLIIWTHIRNKNT